MKLTSFLVTRKTDKVAVESGWINKFKKPIFPHVTLNNVQPMGPSMLTGDVKDVHGFLFGCATIAWSLGWRPAGFLKAMNTWVADYKPQA